MNGYLCSKTRELQNTHAYNYEGVYIYIATVDIIYVILQVSII